MLSHILRRQLARSRIPVCSGSGCYDQLLKRATRSFSTGEWIKPRNDDVQMLTLRPKPTRQLPNRSQRKAANEGFSYAPYSQPKDHPVVAKPPPFVVSAFAELRSGLSKVNVDELLKMFADKLNTLSLTEKSYILYRVATENPKAAFSNSSTVSYLRDMVREQLFELSPNELVPTVWALTKLGVPKALYRIYQSQIAEAVLGKLSFFQTRECISILLSYSRMGGYHTALFQALGDRICEDRQLSASDAAHAFVAFSLTKFPGDDITRYLIEKIHTSIDLLDDARLAEVYGGVGSLRLHLDEKMARSFTDAIIARMDGFTNAELAKTFATVCSLPWPDTKYHDIFIEDILKKFDKLHFDDMFVVLKGITSCGLFHQDLFNKISSKFFAAVKSPKRYLRSHHVAFFLHALARFNQSNDYLMKLLATHVADTVHSFASESLVMTIEALLILKYNFEQHLRLMLDRLDALDPSFVKTADARRVLHIKAILQLRYSTFPSLVAAFPARYDPPADSVLSREFDSLHGQAQREYLVSLLQSLGYSPVTNIVSSGVYYTAALPAERVAFEFSRAPPPSLFDHDNGISRSSTRILESSGWKAVVLNSDTWFAASPATQSQSVKSCLANFGVTGPSQQR